MLKVNAHNNSARAQLVHRVEETEQVGSPWVTGDALPARPPPERCSSAYVIHRLTRVYFL